MKRYWFMALLAAAIVFPLGAFYVRSGGEVRQFRLETAEGSAAEAGKIRIGLSMAPANGGGTQQYEVTTKGSSLESKASLLSELTGQNGELPPERLIRDYRSFMRGKRQITSIYEDQDRLVWVYPRGDFEAGEYRNWRFEVSVLDKKSGKTTSYETPIPDSGSFRYMYLLDVQWSEGTIKAAIRKQGGDGEEIHLYTLGAEHKEDPKDQVLFTSQDGYQGMFAGTGNVKEPNPYLVFYTPKPGEAVLHVFDLSSGKEVGVNFPELQAMMKDGDKYRNTEVAVSGETLMAAGVGADGTRLVTYSMKESKTTGVYDLPADNSARRNPDMLMFSGNRLYVMSMSEMTPDGHHKLPALTVYSTDDGKAVYKGEVRPTGGSDFHGDEQLMVWFNAEAD